MKQTTQRTNLFPVSMNPGEPHIMPMLLLPAPSGIDYHQQKQRTLQHLSESHIEHLLMKIASSPLLTRDPELTNWLRKLTHEQTTRHARHASADVIADRTKAYKPMTNHRDPVVSPISYYERTQDEDGTPITKPVDVYAMPLHIVYAKINSAIRRGVTPEHNIYLQRFNDFVHIAYLAIIDAGREAERVISLLPSGYDIPEQDGTQMYFDIVFSAAYRSCGRAAYDMEKRGREGTTDADACNAGPRTMRICSYERAICDRVVAADFMLKARRLIVRLYKAKRVSKQQATDFMYLLQQQPEKVKTALSTTRKHLKRVLLKYGLLTVTEATNTDGSSSFLANSLRINEELPRWETPTLNRNIAN